MSGVVGLCNLDGRPANPILLETMTAMLAHRGPDNGGIWCDGAIGLGNRLQRNTIESSHEILPLVLAERRLVITADARLDNRGELFAMLNITDHSLPDSLLILLAYDRWGDACPQKLLGDFAFAIWDGRRQALFAARDQMGVKPFFYHYQPGRLFLCASEIKALLCSPELPRKLNEVRVAEYLIPLQEDKENTFYRNLVRLPPAHRLILDQEGLKKEPYWTLDPARQIRLVSDDAYAEALREIFTDAVRVRLRSAFPTGSSLSGGLDSSSVTCIARDLQAHDGKTPWKTFSAVFDEVPESDERTFIHTIIDQGGVEPHYFHADRVGPLYELDRMFWHEDEPFYAPNLFIHWGICQLAKQDGVRVLLDGFDGDSAISHGMARLTELALSGRWVSLAREILRMPQHGLYGSWTAFRRHVVPTLTPDPVRYLWRLLQGRPINGLPRSPIMRQEFAARIHWREHVEVLLESRRKPPRSAGMEHYQRLTWGVVPFIFEVSERAAAAMAIESRSPFFDRRLVEFCLALPAEQKLYQGWNRIVMRRAMEGVLPKAIQWRPRKTSLAQNFNRGLFTFHKDLLEDMILKDPTVIENYVDIDALRLIYKRSLSSINHADTLTVWKALTLGLWLRRTGLQP